MSSLNARRAWSAAGYTSQDEGVRSTASPQFGSAAYDPSHASSVRAPAPRARAR